MRWNDENGSRTYASVEFHANNRVLMALILPGTVAKFSNLNQNLISFSTDIVKILEQI